MLSEAWGKSHSSARFKRCSLVCKKNTSSVKNGELQRVETGASIICSSFNLVLGYVLLHINLMSFVISIDMYQDREVYAGKTWLLISCSMSIPPEAIEPCFRDPCHVGQTYYFFFFPVKCYCCMFMSYQVCSVSFWPVYLGFRSGRKENHSFMRASRLGSMFCCHATFIDSLSKRQETIIEIGYLNDLWSCLFMKASVNRR